MAQTTGSSRTQIEPGTLAITAAASAGAAYVCSKLWAPGTLASAAAMPVLVALLKEAFQRPKEVVSRAVPVRGVVRSARPEREPEPVAPYPGPDPTERVPQPGAVGVPSRRIGRRWRAAIVTGLLGFLVAAVVLTVPELVAGESASGGGRSTTLFGGDEEKEERESERERDREEQTTTAPAATVTVPAPTVTVPQTTTPPATTAAPPSARTAPPADPEAEPIPSE